MPKKRDIYVIEVEDLLALGFDAPDILRALKVTAVNLVVALSREQRHDLAAPFHALAWQERQEKEAT